MAQAQARKPSQSSSPKAPQKNAVARTGNAGVPATVNAAMAKYAGAGISHRMEDNIVPLIYLLQSNSKPVQKGHERYIKGASGGCIWLRNQAPEDSIIDGIEEGMLFQPCHMAVCWIEWLPDRGGFVTRHSERPANAEYKEYEDDEKNIRKGWRMPNGNHVVESREYAGRVFRDDERLPYTIPLSGTGHTFGKSWMTFMRGLKLDDGVTPMPMFGNLFRIKTKLRTKGENSWYQYEFALENAIDNVEDIEAGAALFQAFEAGTKKSAAVEDVGGETGEDSGRAVDED